MPDQGTSFLWPNYCGNLFPCNPDTNDGVTFQMNVHGVDPTLTAVYPTSTYSDAPPYMPGIAVGDYTEMELGTTDAGTHLRAWYLPGQDALGEAKFGTSHLVKAFDFYEKTYGPYAFGPEAGTVAVDWGDDSIGGMEHHPFFHVGKDDFWNEEAQVHEAGHGWFGDGVRLACWEDFVLSEGTTTYITARALESVDGPNLWPPYVDNYLVGICENRGNTIVLPDETCNEIDFEQSPLWSLATYMKGACFYEDVADLVGPEQVDAVIGEFYQTNVNHSARMQDMIDLLKQRSAPEYSSQIDELANEWLRSYDCPPDYARRCRTHQR
jgi:aminopeptidase N